MGVQRSIKRWPGGATVAVVVRDRPWPAVQTDLVEGVVAANGLCRPPRPGPSRAVGRPGGAARRGGGGRLSGTVRRMRSWRLLLDGVAINEVDVEVSYADMFVVLRDGDDEPGPNDWEATLRTPERQHFPPGTYELRGATPDHRRSAATPCSASATATSTTSAATASSAVSARRRLSPPARVAQLVDAEGLNPFASATCGFDSPPGTLTRDYVTSPPPESHGTSCDC